MSLGNLLVRRNGYDDANQMYNKTLAILNVLTEARDHCLCVLSQCNKMIVLHFIRAFQSIGSNYSNTY